MPTSNSATQTTTDFTPLSPRLMWQLAAPHTWPAAIVPCFLAACAASVTQGSISIIMVFVLLAISILMQSSVNSFNDYYDFVKGADSADDGLAADDAVLVYNKVNPRHVLALAVSFLLAAFALGAYVIWVAGFIPLVIGLVGALFVVAYSAGKTPVSYLPLGELISGLVMGGLIMLASYQALTGIFDLRALVWAIPCIIGIGLIMMTNNTCDIEKDIDAKRKTLPVLLGRVRAVKLYHALVFIWIAAIVAIIAVSFGNGLVLMPFMLLISYQAVNVLLKNPLVTPSRIAAMGQICNLNIILGGFYGAAMLMSQVTLTL